MRGDKREIGEDDSDNNLKRRQIRVIRGMRGGYQQDKRGQERDKR